VDVGVEGFDEALGEAGVGFGEVGGLAVAEEEDGGMGG
jgi:hypothetical protein